LAVHADDTEAHTGAQRADVGDFQELPVALEAEQVAIFVAEVTLERTGASELVIDARQVRAKAQLERGLLRGFVGVLVVAVGAELVDALGGSWRPPSERGRADARYQCNCEPTTLHHG